MLYKIENVLLTFHTRYDIIHNGKVILDIDCYNWSLTLAACSESITIPNPYADDDAVVYRLAFSKNPKKLFNECKKLAAENDFIKDRNDFIGKKTIGNGHSPSRTKTYK